MKLFSLRSLLILAVAVAVAANILWRIPFGISTHGSANTAARLAEETRFFVGAQFLPAEERKAKIRERIEGLMNDPGIQADWAGERMKMLAGLTPQKRHEILKKYVQSNLAAKEAATSGFRLSMENGRSVQNSTCRRERWFFHSCAFP